VAAPDRRVVLITGEGSHQLTAQEISQSGRLGLKVTVFVLNDCGYLTERLLCRDPDIRYNDVASKCAAPLLSRKLHENIGTLHH
jgi:indolepyruvate decarboxylase